MQLEKERPVCVLGMHRTGTSMVTRMLHDCGMYLGEERDLMSANAEDNREGYWENKRIVAINDAILALFGGKWDAPPTFPAGWTADSRLAALRLEASKIVVELGGHGFWGWKDPRTCLTFAFWREIVPNVAVVLCVRHPFEVAQSLAGRRISYVSRLRAMDLWHTYYATACADTVGVPNVVTRYVSYFYDPEEELRRVLEVTNLDIPNGIVEIAAQSVDKSLWRGACLDTPDFERRVPTEALQLYRQLCQEAGPVYETLMNDADFQTGLSEAVLSKALNRIESLEALAIERAEQNEQLRNENQLLGRWRFLHPGLKFHERVEASRWLFGAIKRKLLRRPAPKPATAASQEWPPSMLLKETEPTSNPTRML